ncbi:MAG: hypothetical protein K9K79_00890 [Desulfohalobiaceae bacterium]|nr:hypothetical protein [Desulfohalobiaceae bacterium]
MKFYKGLNINQGLTLIQLLNEIEPGEETFFIFTNLGNEFHAELSFSDDGREYTLDLSIDESYNGEYEFPITSTIGDKNHIFNHVGQFPELKQARWVHPKLYAKLPEDK